jgi:uncharacterized OsmC-like protein
MNLPRKLTASLSWLAVLSIVAQPLRAQATHTSQDWAQSSGYSDEGNSLRDYLVRLRASLYLAKDNPETAQPVKFSANVTAESRAGVRHLRIRNFQYLSDGPRASGEFNLGAGSWPSLVGVLGSAVAEEYLTQAAVKGIPLDELEVIFTSTPGTAPSTSTGTQVTYPRNLAYTAYIVSPASDAELEDLRQTVERTSPVIHLVTQHQEGLVAHGQLVYTQTPAKREGKTLEGLREYLLEKHAAADGAVPAEGVAPRVSRDTGEPPLRADIKVEGGTGIRNVRTDVGNFQFIHDNPRFLAGHNLGPVAEEHLIGVMITCLTHIYEIQASQRGLAIDTLRLENEAILSPRLGSIGNPPRYQSINYKVIIGSPETKEAIEQLQKAVESICPVYNLLKDAQPIKGTIVRGPFKEKARTAGN